jgi:MFS family permease
LPSESTPSRADAIQFIVCLGLVSLFADITYEGARSTTGPFLRALGSDAAQVGLIVGWGEFLGFSLRLASGILADRTRAYWTITLLGYAVNLAAVPMLAYARTWPIAAVLIVAERVGKSLRGPARDVLLSEAAVRVGRGWGFGLHAAMDQIGAVIGPLFMVWALTRTRTYGPAFLFLAIPAASALAALLMARSFDITGQSEARSKMPADAPIPRVFWIYTVAAGLLALGYIDFPLIAYHFGKTALFSRTGIPLLYAIAMAMNGITALIFGRLYDRYGLSVLSIGILVSLSGIPLSFLGGPEAAIAGIVCWGTGMGAMDAILRSGISQIVQANKRGRAFGLYNAAFGAAWFVGSTAMGLLYDHWIDALVLLGVISQAVSALIFYALRRQLGQSR